MQPDTDRKQARHADEARPDEAKAQDAAEIATPDEIKDAPAGRKQLDEGLEESMDGSDPPSALQP